MSAFLGPIHHWLYRKIKLQDQLTELCLAYADVHGRTELRAEVDDTWGSMPEGNLEDLIDENNIHGWLQDKIKLVENRYAYVVTKLVEGEASCKENLEQIARQYGKDMSPLQADSSAKQAFDALNNILIDGMPCDHVNQVLCENEQEVRFKRTQCVHESYWILNGGNVSNYYDLRNQWIAGILAKTKLKLLVDDQQVYTIKEA